MIERGYDGMKLVKCNNGHFYNGDRFSRCPYCFQDPIIVEQKTDPVTENQTFVHGLKTLEELHSETDLTYENGMRSSENGDYDRAVILLKSVIWNPLLSKENRDSAFRRICEMASDGNIRALYACSEIFEIGERKWGEEVEIAPTESGITKIWFKPVKVTDEDLELSAAYEKKAVRGIEALAEEGDSTALKLVKIYKAGKITVDELITEYYYTKQHGFTLRRGLLDELP